MFTHGDHDKKVDFKPPNFIFFKSELVYSVL